MIILNIVFGGATLYKEDALERLGKALRFEC
jgi:hypothetical protein